MKRSAWLLAGACTALTAAPAHADVIIGPRVAYYFDNSNLRTSSIAGGVQDEGGLIDEASFELAQELLGPDLELTTQQEGIGVLADQIAIPMMTGTALRSARCMARGPEAFLKPRVSAGS